ncbi:MAG TPA: bacillithiol biosynthesis cysteine-adding enzyme BshC, partial [Chitinophagales bacterium]|nr:bacillithiol biosynthesis cysteine-adding enzyme BshC [Chitinophagales bacterium]
SVFGKPFAWEDKQGGACGEYSTNSIAELCKSLFEAIGDGPHAALLKNMFTDAYLQGHNLAHATRVLLNSLFQDYGLMVVDGNDTQLKANCAAIMQDELFNQSSEKIVNEVLATFPYEAQAKPRNVNLFYLQPNLRERIIYHSDKDIFEINNTTITFSPEQLKKEILSHPENFSPNVILRPLFQQKVLPSLAYIGGGGEIAYWLQLKSLFEYHHIQFPMLLLRDSFLLVDEAAQKKLNKLEISVDHLFGEEQHVIAEYVKTHSSDAINLDAEKTAISELFTGIATKATSIDTSLDKAVMAEQQAVMTSFAKLEAKLLKAEKAKMEVEINQIKGLLTKLFPNGGLQERSENFTAWYLKLGPDFIKMLLENAQQPVAGFTSILVSSN